MPETEENQHLMQSKTAKELHFMRNIKDFKSTIPQIRANTKKENIRKPLPSANPVTPLFCSKCY